MAITQFDSRYFTGSNPVLGTTNGLVDLQNEQNSYYEKQVLLEKMLEAYRNNPKAFSPGEVAQLQSAAQSMGYDFTTPEQKFNIGRAVGSALFNTVDSALFGLLPDEFDPAGENKFEQFAGTAGSVLGAFGLPMMAGLKAGKAASSLLSKVGAEAVKREANKTFYNNVVKKAVLGLKKGSPEYKKALEEAVQSVKATITAAGQNKQKLNAIGEMILKNEMAKGLAMNPVMQRRIAGAVTGGVMGGSTEFLENGFSPEGLAFGAVTGGMFPGGVKAARAMGTVDDMTNTVLGKLRQTNTDRYNQVIRSRNAVAKNEELGKLAKAFENTADATAPKMLGAPAPRAIIDDAQKVLDTVDDVLPAEAKKVLYKDGMYVGGAETPSDIIVAVDAASRKGIHSLSFGSDIAKLDDKVKSAIEKIRELKQGTPVANLEKVIGRALNSEEKKTVEAIFSVAPRIKVNVLKDGKYVNKDMSINDVFEAISNGDVAMKTAFDEAVRNNPAALKGWIQFIRERDAIMANLKNRTKKIAEQIKTKEAQAKMKKLWNEETASKRGWQETGKAKAETVTPAEPATTTTTQTTAPATNAAAEETVMGAPMDDDYANALADMFAGGDDVGSAIANQSKGLVKAEYNSLLARIKNGETLSAEEQSTFEFLKKQLGL